MPTIAEAARSPDIVSSAESVVDNEVQAQVAVQELTAEATLNQKIGSAVLPEMPNAHPEVDVATISVSGLIKNCPHYAERYKVDPEGARAEASKTTRQAQEVTAMREQGMSAKEIKAKVLADNLVRATEKAEAAERVEKVEQKPEPIHKESVAPRTTPTEEVQEQFQSGSEVIAAVKISAPEQVIMARHESAKRSPSVETKPSEPDAAQPVVTQPKLLPRTADKQREVELIAELHTERLDDNAERVIAESEQHAHLQVERAYASTEHVNREIEQGRLRYEAAEDVELSSHMTAPEDAEKLQLSLAPDSALTEIEQQAFVEQASDPEAEADRTTFAKEILYGEDELVLSDILSAEFSNTQDEIDLLPVLENAIATAEVPETITWSDVLEEEPEVIYANFVEALRTVTNRDKGEHIPFIEEETAAGVADIVDALFAEADTGDEGTEPMSAITVTVIERLSKLPTEEKEAAVPLVKGIVTVIQNVREMVVDTANPEDIAIAQAELEELGVTLFDQLKIEYEPEDIERFVAVLLRLEFQLPQPEAMEPTTVDLEHDGTHEAKIHFVSTTAGIVAGAEDGLERLFGTFALFSATARQVA